MAEVIDISGRLVSRAQPRRGYAAFEVSDRPELHLFIVFGDRNSYLILRYGDLESIESAPGQDCNRVVVLRFRGSVTREVRIEGRRLLDMVNYLQCHRVPWIEECQDAKFHAGDDRVRVDRVKVREITR